VAFVTEDHAFGILAIEDIKDRPLRYYQSVFPITGVLVETGLHLLHQAEPAKAALHLGVTEKPSFACIAPGPDAGLFKRATRATGGVCIVFHKAVAMRREGVGQPAVPALIGEGFGGGDARFSYTAFMSLRTQ
jgi:hypothetical protein